MTEIKLEVDTVDAVNSLTVCRICLQESEEEMASIFDRDTSEPSLCVYEKIEKCSGITVLDDPELPTRICRKCNAFLSIAHKFRVMCKNSDCYLREFVSKSTATHIYEEDDDYADDEDHYIEYQPLPANGTIQELDIENEVGESVDYEEIDSYTEMWLHDDEVSNHTNQNLENPKTVQLIPAKTLGISSDGAAVIQIKSGTKTVTMAKEKQQHICDVCGNTYPRKYALEAHMRRHRDEKPYECEICHQAFHLNFQLTRHIRKHTGARPYNCQYCQRAFADRSSMLKHERIHRNERPYTCETCGKNFTYSSVLKVHMLTHTGEKPFNCGICGKRFARGHHLRAHLETLQHQKDPRSKALLKQIRADDQPSYNEEFVV